MTSIEPSVFLNSRQRRRLSAVAHNAKWDEAKARRMPLVVPQPVEAAPTPVQPKRERPKLSGAVQLMFAQLARSMSVRFIGYLPTPSGRRAQARAAGYMNHKHMVAEQNLARLNAEAVQQAASA